MVNGTERHSELVTDFESNAPRLSETDMMSMARQSPANETWLLCHITQMFLRSDPLWFANRKNAFVDLCAGTVVGQLIGDCRLLNSASPSLSKSDSTAFQ